MLEMNQSTCQTLELYPEIVTTITSFFRTEILNSNDAQIAPDDEIISGGLIDSMGIIRLLAHLQARYEIRDFDNRDLILDNFRSIKQIAFMIEKYRYASELTREIKGDQHDHGIP